MKLYLVAVIFTLSLFLISECHSTVTEESSSSMKCIENEQGSYSCKHEKRGPIKHTVKTKAVLGSVFGHYVEVSAILGIADFALGLHREKEQNKESAEIKQKLLAIDRKIDSLADDVDSLKTLTRNVSQLWYFLSYFNNRLHLQRNSTLGPVGLANEWADSVLDLGNNGVAQVLHDFHDMVMGHNRLFGHLPVFVIFEKTLDKESSSYRRKTMKFTEFLLSIQVSGYAMWFTALNIKGRHSEVASIRSVALKRLADQERIMEPLLLSWPEGTYGLPMTNSGCPVAAGAYWRRGVKYHYTEDKDSNGQWSRWSSGSHFPSDSYMKNNMYQHFCMVEYSEGSGSWPRGNYCIFRNKNECPKMGFEYGNIYWDDDDKNNENSVSGALPAGKYDRNTRIDYCCRSDGSADTAIDLPNRKPFYLFRYTSACQNVRGMSVREEYYQWDEDNDNENTNLGSHPLDTGNGRNHKIHYCYYY